MNKIVKRFSEFEIAAIKLSIFYVLIAMTISISFSVALYKISSLELGKGIGRTFKAINQCSPERLPPGFENLENARLEQIEEINGNIYLQLIYFNLIILIVSSLASYFLAKKTLNPLEQAMERQNRFTADASHELKTPLSAMKAEIEVALRSEKLTMQAARNLLISNIEEIDKLENLSDALIKLARYEDGKSNFTNVNISQVLTEAYEKIESLAKKKNIEFENELNKSFIQGDKQSLVELFVILLDNAIKYSNDNSKIEIKVFEEHRKVVVEVVDYGIGINKEDLPHIFDRFFRSDQSRTKTSINGYGLGLSLAKQIIVLHSGEITVSSTRDQGSTFSVKLPKTRSNNPL